MYVAEPTKENKMSYNQYVTNISVLIDPSNFRALGEAILAEQDVMEYSADVSIKIIKADIEEYLNRFCWVYIYEPNGSLSIYQNETSRAIDDEMDCLNLIAPFVNKGSFIEMQGEDHNLWRWVFNGKKVDTHYPTITWPEIE